MLEFLVSCIGDAKSSVRRKALSEIESAIRTIVAQDKIAKIEVIEKMRKNFLNSRSGLTQNMEKKMETNNLLCEIIAKV